MVVDEITMQARRLCEGLKFERAIYESLTELSQRQSEVLSNGFSEEVVELARVKEEQLNRIDSIEQEMAPLKRAWPEIRELIASTTRDEVENELDQVRAVLHRLIALENAGQQKMENARQESADGIRRVEGGRRMQTAYQRGAAASQRLPPRADERGDAGR